MPVTLRPVSRRSFLAGTVAGGLALLARGVPTFGQTTKFDADRVALLSDPHIDADPARVSRDVKMAEHLRAAVEQVLAPAADGSLPSQVVINGDLALRSGEAADYATLLPLLKPMTDGGLPVHLSLGNHDHRDRFRAAMTLPALGIGPADAIVQRNVACVKMPKASLVVLDSLDKTNVTPGLLGTSQLFWLKQTLDELPADKPVIVVMHHNPNPPAPATTKPSKDIGLIDTRPLLDLLLPRRNVKALVTGHLHRWSQGRTDDLHLISLPATSYVFDAKEPSGWIDCRLDDGGAKLTLRCVKADARDGQTVDLRWRA